jgi:hypothetical protein
LTSRTLFSLSHTQGAWGDSPLPPWDPDEAVTYLESAIPVARGLANALPADPESLSRLLQRGELDPGDLLWLAEPPAALPGVDFGNFWTFLSLQTDFARSQWAAVTQPWVELARTVGSFRNRLVPGTFVFLLLLLAALLVAGVIAPMFSLSAHPGSSRTTLLAFFVPLSVLFVLYFGVELFRLRRAADLAREHY